jgi:hypothetical protein
VANSRSTAELNAGSTPLGVLDISHNLVQAEFECHYPDRVGVALAEDSTKTGNLLSLGERHILGVDTDGLLDPLVADIFDLSDGSRGDRLVVREVEAKTVWGDK